MGGIHLHGYWSISLNFTFTLQDHFLRIALTDGSPIPENITKKIESKLSYLHTTFNHLSASFGGGSFISEMRKLFAHDKSNGINCPKGFYASIKSCVESLGGVISVNDLDSDYYKGKTFEVDIDKLDGRLTLRDRQDECLASILSSRGGMVVGPTGFGKSFMFSAICLVYPNAKIHVITKRVDVMRRIHSGLSKYIPNIGVVGAGKKTWSRVTVITADSMHKVGHYGESEADIVLYDEAHEAAAPTYADMLTRYTKAKRFGFTASPDGRADGAHFILEGLFGPNIFELSYSDAVKVDLIVPIKVEWITVNSPSGSACRGMSGVPKERWGIWRNEDRNEAIAKKANQYGKDEQVLIMVKSIEHAVYLKQHLPDFLICYDSMDPYDYEGYVSKGLIDPITCPIMNPARREDMRVGFEKGAIKKVISTDVWSTGVDFAQLGVLIRADARASKIVDIQAPGRVSRKHAESGKSHGLVIDVMDNFDHTFMNRSRSRKLSYKKIGWQDITAYENISAPYFVNPGDDSFDILGSDLE